MRWPSGRRVHPRPSPPHGRRRPVEPAQRAAPVLSRERGDPRPTRLPPHANRTAPGSAPGPGPGARRNHGSSTQRTPGIALIESGPVVAVVVGAARRGLDERVEPLCERAEVRPDGEIDKTGRRSGSSSARTTQGARVMAIVWSWPERPQPLPSAPTASRYSAAGRPARRRCTTVSGRPVAGRGRARGRRSRRAGSGCRTDGLACNARPMMVSLRRRTGGSCCGALGYEAPSMAATLHETLYGAGVISFRAARRHTHHELDH
jgi:hypothetical protein